MNNLLANKTIVIMGVANKKSIAWGCAEAIKSQGGKLIFTYQNERMEKEIRKLTTPEDILIPCDVSDDESIATAFQTIKEKCGNIDGVVHSIAFANKEELEGNFSQTSREGFLLAQNISAYSLVAVTKYASPLMNHGGSIVTMTYIGSQRAIPNYNVMGVAKASLESSVRYLACEMAKTGVRVNAVSAGAIKTLASSGVKDFGKLLQAASDRNPSGENVTIQEVGNVTSFFLSDLSKGVTGEVICVDNGFHLS